MKTFLQLHLFHWINFSILFLQVHYQHLTVKDVCYAKMHRKKIKITLFFLKLFLPFRLSFKKVEHTFEFSFLQNTQVKAVRQRWVHVYLTLVWMVEPAKFLVKSLPVTAYLVTKVTNVIKVWHSVMTLYVRMVGNVL